MTVEKSGGDRDSLTKLILQLRQENLMTKEKKRKKNEVWILQNSCLTHKSSNEEHLPVPLVIAMWVQVLTL